MAQLSRVRGPRSPFDGRWGWTVGAVGLAFIVAVLKPWGWWSDRPPPAGERYAFTTPDAGAAPTTGPVSLPWRPDAFGPTPPDPAWEIWTTDGVTRVRFVGPDDGFAPPRPSAGPGSAAIVGGPVVELGSADTLTVLAINQPADTWLSAVRLWRLVDGGWPERVELGELPAPWPVPHFRVFAPRTDGVPREEVLAWLPGLYRLDLLIDPADRIRTLLLVVRPGPGLQRSPSPRAEGRPFDPGLLRRLPAGAIVWSQGSVLAGWSRRPAPADCRVADVWRAVDVDAPCHPIPVGRPTAVGVNLPGTMRLERIELRQVDPLPGLVDAETAVDVHGRAGLGYALASRGPLADGIYRLSAVTGSGATLTYYLEVGPSVHD